jgi:hypothetical protein
MKDPNKLIPFPQSEQSSILTHFGRAREALELAATVDEVKIIRDQAEALRQYARQQKLSLEMQNKCAEIKIRAERRAGEILLDMDKNQGGRTLQKCNVSFEGTAKIPKLSDLGISRNQSSRWQLIACIPEEDFDSRVEEIKSKGAELTSREFLSLAGYLQRERQRGKLRRTAAEEAKGIRPNDRIRLFHGDFRQVLNEDVVPSDSVSLLLTDPMYGREHLPLWHDLSRFASRILKTGSLLVAYSGQTYLPEVMKSLEEHLTYVWVAGVKYSFPNNIFPLRIKNTLKLLLLFSKGTYDPGPSQFWLHDLINGDCYPETKRDSKFQQGVKEAEYLIETLTNPGDIVVDPFIGTGTVSIAAKKTGRRFIGAEILEERFNLAVSRLAQEESCQDQT